MYTHSRSAENPEAAHRKLPIGWSEDGITEYNRIYDAVEIDRKSNGIQFGHELFKIFEARVNGKNDSNTVMVQNQNRCASLQVMP